METKPLQGKTAFEKAVNVAFEKKGSKSFDGQKIGEALAKALPVDAAKRESRTDAELIAAGEAAVAVL